MKLSREQHRISGVMIISKGDEDRVPESLDNILPHVNEMIILDNDSYKGSEVVKDFSDPENKIKIVKIPFFEKMNFPIGDIKNFACTLVNSWWTLLLDPDETIEELFYERIHYLMDQEDFDVAALPRKNYLDGKRTSHYPDWQLRFRRSFVRYVYGVHHEAAGFQRRMDLPTEDIEDGYHIIHKKTNMKQKEQISRYYEMENKFSHFCRQAYEDYSK